MNDLALRKAAEEFFGPIQIPPGSQIVYQDGGRAEWIDPEGYKHTAQRSLDGRDPNAGKLVDNTDRPAIMPDKSAQGLQQGLAANAQGLSDQQFRNLDAAARGENPAAFDVGNDKRLSDIDALAARLQSQQGLNQLDPQTMAALKAISDAEQARNAQQFEKDQGTLVAQLYGNRVNQSSIAGQNAAQLLQSQGLVSQQQQADAGMRQLQTQQYSTDAQRADLTLALQSLLGSSGAQLEGFKASRGAAQSQLDSWLALLNSLTGQQTTRDVATGQIGLGDRELAERGRATNLDFDLRQQDADMRLAAQNSTWNKVMQGINAASQVAGIAAGGLGGFKFGGGSGTRTASGGGYTYGGNYVGE